MIEIIVIIYNFFAVCKCKLNIGIMPVAVRFRTLDFAVNSICKNKEACNKRADCKCDAKNTDKKV